MNEKYRITDVVHPENPKLHRIEALCNIGKYVKAGDLGGFVESENNLSFAPGDTAWIYDDAIACGESVVEKGAALQNRAVACGHAMVTKGATLFDDARAEDDSYIKGGLLCGHSRAAGATIIVAGENENEIPTLFGICVVYGRVQGDIHLNGSTVVLSNETIFMPNRDRLEIDNGIRKVVSYAQLKQERSREQDKLAKEEHER